jgi:hypothetical protein
MTNCDDTIAVVAAVDAVAGHRLDHRPFLPKQSRRLVYVDGVYPDTARPPSTVVRYLKEEGVADRLPIAVHRRSLLSHSASPLICIELEQIAFLILIFVRRDCDAGKIAAECCKLLTVGTRENGVVRASRPMAQSGTLRFIQRRIGQAPLIKLYPAA